MINLVSWSAIIYVFSTFLAIFPVSGFASTPSTVFCDGLTPNNQDSFGGTNPKAGFVFTPSAPLSVSSLGVDLLRYDALYVGNYRVNVWTGGTVSSGGSINPETGTLLGTSPWYSASGLSHDTYQVATLSFPSPISLNTGTRYYVIFETDTLTSGTPIVFRDTAPASCPDGTDMHFYYKYGEPDYWGENSTARFRFFVNGIPAIQIILDPFPTDNRYVIDATPTMPVIRARAKVINITPDPTSTTTFTWIASLRINKKIPETCAVGDEVSFDQDINQNTETIGDAIFTMELKKPKAFRGGRLKLTAKATVNGEVLSGETPDGLSIQGANPQRTNIQNNIDEQVPLDGFSGLENFDIQDVLKRIGCQESNQRQFNAQPNGEIGPALISCDNGVGIFQITSTNSCSDPFTKCPNTLFDWNANVTAGVQTYREKIAVAKKYPNRLKEFKGTGSYRDYIKNTINPTRKAMGLKPINGVPAPQFTTTGLIGVNPPNQLLEDGVRGYNGFAGTAFGLNMLHEFIPDGDFLLTVPDSELGGLNENPKVWRGVMPEDRPQVGDPNYVNNVTAQSPQCGG